MGESFNAVKVLEFLSDAGLVASGYTLATHGWAWTPLPLMFTATCAWLAERALRADVHRSALSLAWGQFGGGNDG